MAPNAESHFRIILHSFDALWTSRVQSEVSRLFQIDDKTASNIITAVPIVVFDGLDLQGAVEIRKRMEPLREAGCNLVMTDEAGDESLPRINWPELPEFARLDEVEEELEGEESFSGLESDYGRRGPRRTTDYGGVPEPGTIFLNFACPCCGEVFQVSRAGTTAPKLGEATEPIERRKPTATIRPAQTPPPQRELEDPLLKARQAGQGKDRRSTRKFSRVGERSSSKEEKRPDVPPSEASQEARDPAPSPSVRQASERAEEARLNQPEERAPRDEAPPPSAEARSAPKAVARDPRLHESDVHDIIDHRALNSEAAASAPDAARAPAGSPSSSEERRPEAPKRPPKSKSGSRRRLTHSAGKTSQYERARLLGGEKREPEGKSEKAGDGEKDEQITQTFDTPSFPEDGFSDDAANHDVSKLAFPTIDSELDHPSLESELERPAATEGERDDEFDTRHFADQPAIEDSVVDHAIVDGRGVQAEIELDLFEGEAEPQGDFDPLHVESFSEDELDEMVARRRGAGPDTAALAKLLESSESIAPDSESGDALVHDELSDDRDLDEALFGEGFDSADWMDSEDDDDFESLTRSSVRRRDSDSDASDVAEASDPSKDTHQIRAAGFRPGMRYEEAIKLFDPEDTVPLTDGLGLITGPLGQADTPVGLEPMDSAELRSIASDEHLQRRPSTDEASQGSAEDLRRLDFGETYAMLDDKGPLAKRRQRRSERLKRKLVPMAASDEDVDLLGEVQGSSPSGRLKSAGADKAESAKDGSGSSRRRRQPGTRNLGRRRNSGQTEALGGPRPSSLHVRPPEGSSERLDAQAINDGSYGLVLSRIANHEKREEAARLISEIKGVPYPEAMRLTERTIIPVLKGVDKALAERQLERFKQHQISGRVTKRRSSKSGDSLTPPRRRR